MPQSLLKRIYRLVLRWLYRPLLGPPAPLSIQRRLVDFAGRTLPRPSEVQMEALGSAPVSLTRFAAGGDDPPNRPALLWVHGGGFVLGSPTSHGALASHIATEAGADVYLPRYRLAPEDPFPAAVDDVFAAYRHVLDRGHDPKRVAIGGDSAGGTIAILAALAIKEMDVPSPAAMVLVSPVTDLSLSGQSVTTMQHKEALLRRDWLQFGYRSFAGSLALTDPRVSPQFADLHGLPPTLIQVGEYEILLDDALRWADRAWGADVEVELQRFPGMWHDFQMQAAFIDEAAQAVGDIGGFLRRRWA